MSGFLEGLKRLYQQGELDAELSHPRRLQALERFRAMMVEACGEEPCVVTALNAGLGADTVVDVPLSDFLGLTLQARHAAIYRAASVEDMRCLAAFGREPGLWPVSGVLPRMVTEGPLLRSRMRLDALSYKDAEALVRELDVLGAELVIPVLANERLELALVVGSSINGRIDGEHAMSLTLYGLAMWRALLRRDQSLPTRAEQWSRHEAGSLQALDELWRTLRPSQPVDLLIVDEVLKTVDMLSRVFTSRGFAVRGCTSQEQALQALASRRPQILLVDLSLNRRMPTRLLEATRQTAPDAVVLGTTTGYPHSVESSRRQLGLNRIFTKPLRLAPLVNELLEVALRMQVIGPRVGR